MNAPSVLLNAGGGSIARRLSLVGSLAIALVMLAVCAVMAWSTARQTRAHVADFAGEKAAAAAQALDAFDSASRVLAERFHANFASSFGPGFQLDEAQGELWDGHLRLNGHFAAVDEFTAHTGGVATVFARQGDDFVRITTSLKKENGDRALGTPLGRQHPAHAPLMAGQSYTGRAVLFGRHYMTRYAPVKDAAGQVVGILFIGFDLSSFQTTLDQMVARGRLFDSGGLAIIDPKRQPADAVFIAHPTAKGRKVLEAYPGAEATLAALQAAGETPVDLAVPLLGAGHDRWAQVRKSALSGWWVVAEVADGEAMRPHYAAMGPFLALFAGAAVVLGAGLGWVLRRSVAQPLQSLGESLAAVAQGDLTRPVSVQRNDEIGCVAAQAEAMRQTLAGTLAGVQQAADAIRGASTEVASGNADLSQRTEQTASQLQQAGGALAQLTDTVRHSAEAAAQARQLAGSASDVAQRGGSLVTQVVGTMDAIHGASRRIADIVGTIDGIAFQTNILALNAAVEAARAGEQGRGFAVVASEVRSLAQRSAEAAREIKGLIGDSVTRVEAGARLVHDAGATMDEIVGSVKRVTDVIGEVSAAADEQRQGIAQVNGAVGQLDQMTQQNAALVEQSAAAAESLREQAERLTQVVGTFRLDGAADAVAAMPRQAPAPAAAVARPVAAEPAPARRPAPAPPAGAPTERAESTGPGARPAELAQQVIAHARAGARPPAPPAGDDWESF